MAFKSLYFLLIIVTVGVLLMTREVASSRVTRQKRSDDGGPLESVVEQLSKLVTSLNAKVAVLETKTNTLDKTVAFHAWSDANPLQTLPQGALILNHVVTNIGSAYDPVTGIFTAPLSGLYDFQATIMEYHVKNYAEAGIYIDSHLVAMGLCDNRHGSNYDQSSMKAVVHVNAGSKVALKNLENSTSDFYGVQFTTFSGYLIKAD